MEALPYITQLLKSLVDSMFASLTNGQMDRWSPWGKKLANCPGKKKVSMSFKHFFTMIKEKKPSSIIKYNEPSPLEMIS